MNWIWRSILYGIVVLVLTALFVADYFPNVLSFQVFEGNSLYIPLTFLISIVISRILDRNRPGTYEQEKKLWLMDIAFTAYFFILPVVFTLLGKKSHHGLEITSPYLWFSLSVLIFGNIQGWRKVQERKRSSPLEQHPLLKDK
ncbi:hypothetical protein ACFDTO_23940 [Microbacteriaceae bacterium 4G12]